MRYHYGLGVGHVYSHKSPSAVRPVVERWEDDISDCDSQREPTTSEGRGEQPEPETAERLNPEGGGEQPGSETPGEPKQPELEEQTEQCVKEGEHAQPEDDREPKEPQARAVGNGYDSDASLNSMDYNRHSDSDMDLSQDGGLSDHDAESDDEFEARDEMYYQ